MQVQSVHVSSRLVEVMCDSISSLCLVRECRELEEMCGVAFTDRLLKGELMWGKNLKEEIRRVGRAQLLDRCGLRALPYSTSGETSWMGKSLGCSL